MRRLLLVCLAIMGASACGSSSSPTAPSTPANPTTSTFSLTGQVTSTNGGGIAGATVAFADGANAGKSSTTDASGNYAISALVAGGFTVNFSAPNFFATSKGVAISGNTTLSAQLAPTPLFTQNGSGNTVFNIPTSVVRLHIVGTFTGNSSNFIVWNGPGNVNCDSTFNTGCHLIVNDLIGTGFGRTVSDGTYIGTGGATMQIYDSAGVSWSFTEVR